MKILIFLLLAIAFTLWTLAFAAQAGETGRAKQVDGAIVLYACGALIAVLAELIQALS